MSNALGPRRQPAIIVHRNDTGNEYMFQFFSSILGRDQTDCFDCGTCFRLGLYSQSYKNNLTILFYVFAGKIR